MLINKKDLIIYRTLALDKILHVYRLSGNVSMNRFVTYPLICARVNNDCVNY